jgi:hypothetical protein
MVLLMVFDRNSVGDAPRSSMGTNAKSFERCSNGTNRLPPTKFSDLLKMDIMYLTHSDIYHDYSKILDLNMQFLDQNRRIALTMLKSSSKNVSRPLSTILTTTR